MISIILCVVCGYGCVITIALEKTKALMHIKPTFKQVSPDFIATVHTSNALHI